jgi:hypothetical protein
MGFDILSAEDRGLGDIGRFLVVTVLLAAPLCSQQAAGFAGMWRMDPERSESAHQAVPIGPVTLIIKATPAELTIETRRAGKGKVAASRETLQFHLDGSENVLPGNSGVWIKTKGRLDRGKLVTEVTRNIQGSTVTSVQIFSLDAKGNEMTVDKTLTVQHGYQSTSDDANNTGKGKDVFVRVGAWPH